MTDIIERLRKQLEIKQGDDIYASVDISEWGVVRDLCESPSGEILLKIQNLIYNGYVRKMVGELRLAMRSNKKVDASIYGGLLEGIANVSIDRLSKEAKHRLEKWERDNNGDKTGVQESTTD